MARSLNLAVATAAAALLVVPAYAAEPQIAVELSAEKASLRTDDEVVVQFTITNLGERARSIYRWDTPLQEVENDLFSVQRNGEEVAYLGIIAKRGHDGSKEDYVRIAAGRSLSATVELSSLYDMTQPGVYTVQYRKGLAGLDPASRAGQDQVLTSNALSLELSGEPLARPFLAPGPSVAGTAYSKCTNAQISTIGGEALPAAKGYASSSLSSLNGTAGARYTTWFGAYTSTRYSTVKSHFTAINNAFNNETITVDCGCKKTYYAYVYPSQPYKIYVCKAFWTAPMTGTDSKAGTLIHEMSHFTVLGGTDDWAYGHSAAKSLAISDPTKAVDNADSHEYYAENTPAQQ